MGLSAYALVLAPLWLSVAGPKPPLRDRPPPPPPPLRADLPAAHDRPATRLGMMVGGGVPSAAVVVVAAEKGVAPLLALRGSGTTLIAGPAAPAGQPPATAWLMAGPSLTVDALSWVPRLSLQAGLQIYPVAPAVQLGAGIERFVSMRISVQVGILGTWLGTSRWRGDVVAGLGYTL